MFIKNLVIENFRGFKTKTSIEFQDGINVLIGANNAGKTTILKALELLFSSENSKKLKIEDFNHDISISSLKKASPKIILSALLIESDNEDEYSDDLISVSSWLTRIEKPYEAMITFEFSLPIKYEEDYKNTLSNINSLDSYTYWQEIESEFLRKYTTKIFVGNPQYKISIDPNSLQSFDFQFLTAIRDVERDLFSGSNTLLKEIIEFFMDYEIKTDSNIDKSERKLKIKDLKTNFSKEANKLINNLQTRMSSGKKEILKYVDDTGANFDNINPDFDGSILENELYSSLKLIVETETGIKLPATRNGLGYNNLLFISILLAKMQKDASKEYLGSNSKNFSILAFEEPEAHLHPNMQYKLLKFLNKNKQKEVRQIFVTTHSPNITAAVDLNSIISLSKINHEIKISYPGKVFSSCDKDQNSKKYIERFLDVTKADMFFAKNLIFVEGLAEQILIPTFSEILGLSLTDNHVSVVNVNGRYFDHFIKLFDTSKSEYAIQKKIACITDRDSVKKEKINSSEETTKSSAWKACFPFEINLDLNRFEYKEISNPLLENNYKNSIKVFTQNIGSTFEYELIFENFSCKNLITSSVKNNDNLQEMMSKINSNMTKDDLLSFISSFKTNSNLRVISTQYIETANTTTFFEKAKHIIAARYLTSITKGEIAQELSMVIYNNANKKSEKFNFNVPKYIKEALEWICK